ncbi:MAG TPA: discoidin domain-containing protein, partial [Pseudacidobacterium sp.]|nr:discoidin domain-containing protein [Pseudacidobacterium sp.]
MQRIIFAAFVTCAVSIAPAQTIHVSISPANRTNTFIPVQTLGAGVDRIPREAFEKDFVPETLATTLSSGWQTVTYRQNTELAVQAWHWNPKGTWSDPSGKGYFTGSTDLGDPIRHSYGYVLPHRGVTRNDGTGNTGFSRLTDGDPNSYWKSNPYLTQRFTGEDDALHPQWVILDLAANQMVDTIRIDWAEPYATRYSIQYWTGDDPIHAPTRGIWQTFQHAEIVDGKGGAKMIRLASPPMQLRFVRILMTVSSNTCDTHGSSDLRNCVGYAIRELSMGTISADGQFHDLVRHTPDQEQTATICSSVDPWHEPDNLESTFESQVGFDFFYASGITRGLPAMIPVAMLYDTPENAAAEISYIEKRHYPLSYVEMGEESDGQYMLPEDYAALYLQWATALHRVDPSLKLGGPAFQGVNKDIEVWPDDQGRTSWLGRFIDYLRKHQRMNDLSFFSFEHYPYEPCKISWSSLYDEPSLVSHIMQVWRDDGLPANVPMFITESNLSSSTSETYMDIFSAVWLADYIGTFLTSGGNGVYYFHYLPLQL